MITSYQAANKYASENGLPPFDPPMMKQIGAFIYYHFKKYWVWHQTDEVLAQAGYVRSLEGNRTYIVVGYPDIFEPQMMARIGILLEQKAKPKDSPDAEKVIPVQEHIKEVRKRKRIPVKQ